MLRRLRYRYLVPLVSRMPDRLLRWLDHHVPIDRRPEEFNWSFWTDASYLKWCRMDQRRGGSAETETAFDDL